jgi:hypothetical protein
MTFSLMSFVFFIESLPRCSLWLVYLHMHAHTRVCDNDDDEVFESIVAVIFQSVFCLKIH